MISTGRMGAWVGRMLDLDGPPSRTAAAFALGVFFGFSPFIGLQTVTALSCAYVFGLNRLAVFCGLNVNVPWLMGPWYLGTTWLAAALFAAFPGSGQSADLDALLSLSPWSAGLLDQPGRLLGTVLWSLLVGSTAGAALVGAGTFLLARRYLERRGRA